MMRVWLILMCWIPRVGFAAATATLLQPEETSVRVSERVVFAIEVEVAGRFSGTTHIDIPEVPGVIILQPDSRPALSTRVREGVPHSVQRHAFVLFVRRSTEVEIPGFTVRCGSVAGVEQAPENHRLVTGSFRLSATRPPGAPADEPFLITERFSLQESWDPAPGKARPGDAFKRVITLTAEGVPGMLLPDLAPQEYETVRVYRSPPQPGDEVFRGLLTGQRVDAWTYVCEQSGEVLVPGIRVHWLNPQNQRWSIAELPAVEFTIEGGPGEEPVQTDGRGLIFIGAGVLAFLAVLGWVGGRHLFAGGRRSGPASEVDLARQLIASCKRGQPAGTLKLYGQWVHALGDRKPAATDPLEWMHISLQREVLGLENTWNAQDFARWIKAYRADLRKKRSKRKGVSLVARLNES